MARKVSWWSDPGHILTALGFAVAVGGTIIAFFVSNAMAQKEVADVKTELAVETAKNEKQDDDLKRQEIQQTVVQQDISYIKQTQSQMLDLLKQRR